VPGRTEAVIRRCEAKCLALLTLGHRIDLAGLAPSADLTFHTVEGMYHKVGRPTLLYVGTA
jgi:hypothetical protein